MLTLASAKLTGIPSPSAWSHVYAFRDELFLVVASGFPYPEVAARVEEEYFGHPDLKPFNALKLAVGKAVREIHASGKNLEMVAISYVEGTVYSAATGGSKILIDRAGSLATILASKEGEVASASGYPKDRDMILLGTKAFFEKVPQEIIKSSLDSLDPEAASKTFTDIIQREKETGSVGAMVVKFEEKVGEVSEEKAITPQEPQVKVKPKLFSISGFEPTVQGKKSTLLVGILLLIILVVSIGFGMRQKNLKEEEARISQEQEKAKELEASGHYNANPELFLDLTLLSSGFRGDILSTSGGDLFVLDKNGKKVVSIEIATKKSSVVAGAGKLEEALDLASYEDRVFVLASDGINEVQDDVTSVIDKSWEGDALIHAFAGNLYVLDKSANAIYRYTGSDNEFGGKQNWLSASTKPDFSDARSWTFDGAIYVLNSSGKVLKFSQGSPQAFSLPSEVISVDAIFANDENEFLYILDKVGKKVVVVAKNGEFKAQYSSDNISEAVGLMALESEKKIILLTGEKLLSVEMRHF